MLGLGWVSLHKETQVTFQIIQKHWAVKTGAGLGGWSLNLRTPASPVEVVGIWIKVLEEAVKESQQ